MLSSDIIKKIKKIEIRSRKLANEVFAGQYSSVFKGRGMEFSEVREYMPGDDVRTIDWNVTARYGKPFVKKFTEEREMTVILLVDASASLGFGTKEKFKNEIAAEFAATLAFSAIKNNDRVGMLIFTDRVEKVIRPKKGKNHILRLIRDILFFKPQGHKTNISDALKHLNDIWKRKAVVFLLSDFQDNNFEAALKVTSRKHDLIAVKISDPRENNMADIGLIEFEDPESGLCLLSDTSARSVINASILVKETKNIALKKLFSSSGVDTISVSTDKPYTAELIAFFKRREKRMTC
ncbi:MAG: DUF58 domain-containing protein [Endomicrobiales bacterium]|nr:DUF58 domain-containing protein [Endomicrobiales bacterium]